MLESVIPTPSGDFISVLGERWAGITTLVEAQSGH